MKPTAQSERLSALLDDELSEIELRHLLAELDDEQAGHFARWQLARDLIHGQSVARVPDDFSKRLAAQLHDQPAAPLLLRAGASLARLAVAASVALALVLGWQYQGANGELPQVADQRPLLLAESALVSGRLASPGGTPVASERPAQLDDLIVRHTDFAARHGGQGLAPLVRFVGMEAARSTSQ